jgi:hypothetical protein
MHTKTKDLCVYLKYEDNFLTKFNGLLFHINLYKFFYFPANSYSYSYSYTWKDSVK